MIQIELVYFLINIYPSDVNNQKRVYDKKDANRIHLRQEVSIVKHIWTEFKLVLSIQPCLSFFAGKLYKPDFNSNVLILMKEGNTNYTALQSFSQILMFLTEPILIIYRTNNKQLWGVLEEHQNNTFLLLIISNQQAGGLHFLTIGFEYDAKKPREI